MRVLIFICFISIILYSSCKNERNPRLVAETEIKDSLNDFRLTRDTFFDRANLDNIIQNVHKDSIVGVWKDSVHLILDNNEWRGWLPIDKKNIITFYKSSKYKWEIKNRYSKLDTVKYGKYWTSNYNDSSFLTLMFNMNSDTVFNQGDTGYANSFLIDYYNIDTLLISPFYRNLKDFVRDESFMMFKTK